MLFQLIEASCVSLSWAEFKRPGHEIGVELKHGAVSGIGIDDEVAIRKTPRQIVRVLASSAHRGGAAHVVSPALHRVFAELMPVQRYRNIEEADAPVFT
jgi:hypothetical protein